MPATTLAHPGANKQAQAPALLVPFTRSAREHTEVMTDLSQQITASAVSLPQQDVPAYGFLRGIRLLVEATGGAGASTVTAAEDAPWSAIDELVIRDVNGAPIVGPLSGYDLYLINKYGGREQHSPDPKQRSSFSAVAVGAAASGNFAFSLYIPIEVSGRDALGSLANQNAASTYKMAVTLAPSSRIYGVAPNTTLPTVRVRAVLDAWTQPTQADLRGNGQAQTPPAHGTTSYWSKTTLQVSSGVNTLRLPRVGNYIREMVFVYRDAGGSRANGEAAFPDPFSIYWDTRLLHQRPVKMYRDTIATRVDLTGANEAARGRDNGVYVEDFAHDFNGALGYELRDGWLPTSQSTRLEVQGSFGSAGVLTVLTNDVAPAGEIFV
jgi:hypothetical protein